MSQYGGSAAALLKPAARPSDLGELRFSVLDAGWNKILH